MRRSVSILLLVLFMGGSSFAALTGIKTIGVDYPTLAAAIADLNAQGVGSGGVTFNVPANYTETFTLPTAGYITTTTGASGSPVLFQKSGSGSNPVITSAAGAGTMDAIILVAGCDYVTFDGIDLKDNVTNTTPLNQAEWGYAIVKNSAIDGSQNITIKNCAINLNISYTATIGIYSNNHIINDATPLTVTSVTGGNSSNSFDNNTINSYTSISIIGYNDAVVPYSFLDQNNKIGKNGGNTITNVAGGSVAGYGIYTNGQNNLEVANNIITSTMAGTGQPSGIYLTNARNASYDLYNNNVTLHFTGAGATYLNAIYCDMGSTGTSNTMNVYNNVVSGCTFSTVTSGYVYLLYMANLGANVNVHDNNVINNTIGSSSVAANGRIYYLYCNRNTPVTGPMNIYNNTITGNTRIQSAPGGGLTYGLGALGYVTSLNLYNNNFSNNIIASNGGTYSFYLSLTGPRNIYDNLISNITKAEGTFYGIYVTTLTNNAGDGLVYRNKVQNIEGLTAGSNIYGIYSSSSGNPTYYYNNFISDLRTPNSTSQTGVVGLYNSAGTPSGFYNNSVYINTASAGTNFGSTALYSSTSAGLDLRGNILVNTSLPSGTGKTTAIRFSGTSLANFTTASNYNDLYVPNGPSNYLFFDGTTGDQTLAAYKSRVMPRDAQSVTEMPPFINITTGSNNLHLQTTVPTQCEAGGTVITFPVPITADIDGNPRYPNAGYPVNASSTPYAPDMGADEIGGLANDLTGPAVTYTPLANTNTSLPRTLDIVVTDGSGVATSGIGLPMLYWKINSGTYQGVQATVVSPNTYSFSFGGGANIGDIVSYYIAAQDQSPALNVTVLPMGGSGYSANPPACSTPPSGPNSYTILENISGIKHIGVGKDFTTLGEASVAINTRWISGPLTLVLDDPTYPSETFPISFSTNPGSSPTNILTIRPNTGVSPVLQAVATGLFNFNGIDYVVIDGSNNGTNTKDLSIKNHSTSTGAYAVAFMSNNGDPSTNVTIKNSILSCKPVNSSVVDITVIKTVSPGGSYNNITLDNNTIRAGFYAIRNNGVSGAQNSNWQITNNIIGSELDSLAISDVGISLSYATNTFIFNNDIMGPASGSLNVGQTGVYIGTNAYSTIVRSNKIHDFVRTSDDGWGVTGIWFASDATTVTEISNNAIYNIKSPGINPGVGQNITYGIFVRSGGNIKILHNSINLTGAVLSNFYEASSACLGFYYQATGGNVEVRDNIFRNGMTTLGGAPNAYGKAYGIMLSTSAGMFSTINNNDYFIDGYNGMIAQFYVNGVGTIIEYPTLADWQVYTGQEANSLNVNPAFTSATYLLPTTTAMPHAGSYISSLPVDIAGITRTNPPDVGAYEFSVNPLIVTTAAAPVSNVTATFNGTANASNTTFDLFFDYGLSTSYGTSVSATPATVTGNSLNTMSYNVSGLTPLTTYHYRARGVTSTGLIVYGNDMTFTTLPDPPAVVTTAATLITGSSATLNGTVNANTSNATPSFEYGLTTSYGTTIAATPGSVSGNTTTPISAAISGLLPNSTYHYRAFATNVTGTGYGLDMTFNTPPILSVVVTNVATSIGSTSAQINGTVTANNASTTVSFQWGLTNAYGNTISATPASVNGMTATAVLANLPGLTINTTYHYRCVGVNAAGTSYGLDQIFTTNCVAPVVSITGPAVVCAASVGNVYSTQAGNFNYSWVVSPGGTITSGAGTNSITVTWNTAGPQTVSVNYSNSYGCSANAPSVYNVTVNAQPTPTITGPSVICQGTTGNTYTTQAGMTGYNWTVSAGGTITSGAGTNAIQVTWTGSGAQTVSVNYSNASGCSATTPTGYNVTVNAAPAPTITGTTSLCENSGYYFYSTEAGMTGYIWTISAGGSIVSGQGTNQVQVTWNASGNQTISVNYANGSGCMAQSPTTSGITVNPAPGPAGTITGTSAVCGGATGIAYSVAPITNALTYVWTLPAGATIASGSGTNSITVDYAANASSGNITVYGNNLCGNGTTSPVFPVTVTPLPGDPGTISGLTEICQATSGVVYSVSPVTGASGYNWTVPSGASIVDGNNTNTITVDYSLTAVSGDITVNAVNSCGTSITSTLAVVVNPIPENPVISLNGYILSSDAPSGNQWYFEGSTIPGATGQTYDASLTGSGWYWSVVTMNGCTSDTSNHIYVLITGLGEVSSTPFSIFPVPNDGRFTFTMSTQSLQVVRLYVFNNLGARVYESPNLNVNGTIVKEIDLRPVPSGLYTVVIETPAGKMMRKIIVNR